MTEQKVMLITGTSRSIGEHLARHYAQNGFNVIGCSRHPVQIELPNYKHFCLDVRDEAALKQMFLEVGKSYGHLTVLINNAGIQMINHSLLSDVKSAKDVFDINMFSAFLCCREAAKLMKRSNFGRVVNISSIAVPLCSVGNSIYSASKAALEQFSKVFAREVVGFGITVNILGLPIVAESGMEKNINEAAKKDTLARTITQKAATYNDIINSLDFFISEKSTMITGQTLYLGGV